MKTQNLSKILAVIIVILTGCVSNNNLDIDDCFRAAGSNQKELKRVLTHYSSPKDSLKLKAATFLLQNMLGHGTISSSWINFEGEEIEPDVNTYKNIFELRSSMDSLGYYQIFNKKINDCENITSKYLVKNIDLAFTCWYKSQQYANTTFAQFCELILPYRIGVEKLEDWRTPVIKRFQSSLDSLVSIPDSLSTSNIIEKLLKRYEYYYNPKAMALSHHLSFSEMMKYKIGTCEDHAQLQVLTCRALGIPAAMDFIPMWGSQNGGHARLMYMDNDGKMKIYKDGDHIWKRPAKVFRRVFSNHTDLHDITAKKGDIPPILRDSHYVDSTKDHCKCSDILIQPNNIPEREKCLFIYIFNYGQWKPIYWGLIHDDKKVCFKNMGNKIIYRVGTYHQGKTDFLTEPFLLNQDGHIKQLDTFSESTDTLKVSPDWGTSYLGEMSIKENETYELFVWDNGWQQIGQSIASYNTKTVKSKGKLKDVKRLSITFPNTPKDALLRISNSTLENRARIFIWNGNQINWY